MRIGLCNESKILVTFQRQSWTECVFSFGLLGTSAVLWISASPDGIDFLRADKECFDGDENLVDSITKFITRLSEYYVGK